MSRDKDIQRAEQGLVFRSGKLIPIDFVQDEPAPPLFMRCSKCKDVVSEAFVEKHINECQHGKAECGKCKTWIAAADFLRHFKSCEGNKKE
jgi:hypothetical protein